MELTKAQSERVRQYLALRDEKGVLGSDTKKLESELERLKALILADMGGSRAAVYADGCGSYTVTVDPSRRVGILKDNLLRLKECHPDIYEQYVTVSESQK